MNIGRSYNPKFKVFDIKKSIVEQQIIIFKIIIIFLYLIFKSFYI